MKKALISFTFLMAFCISGLAQADKIVGRWKTIDDKDGSEKSIVLIFKATNGKYYGTIEKLFKNPNGICSECEGANKNKPNLGLRIINNLVEIDGKLTGGTILDPKNGKVYKCNISFDAKSGNLIVRGSLDSGGFIGRSQTWIRA
ncbi:MAG: DUF2147 domain-containing protein [Paludibacter sp.]